MPQQSQPTETIEVPELPDDELEAIVEADERAREIDEDDMMTHEQLDAHMRAGVDAFAQEAFEASARFFLAVALAVPDNADAWLAYATSRFATGDYDLAAAAIRRGIRQMPEVVNSLFDLRDRYTRMAMFDQHLDNLEAYVDDDPLAPDGWIVLGFVLHFSGDREEANRVFRTVMSRFPEDGELADVFIRAKSLEELQQLEREAYESEAADPDARGSDVAPDGVSYPTDSDAEPFGAEYAPSSSNSQANTLSSSSAVYQEIVAP